MSSSRLSLVSNFDGIKSNPAVSLVSIVNLHICRLTAAWYVYQREEDYRSEIAFLQKAGGDLKNRIRFLELELAASNRERNVITLERVKPVLNVVKYSPSLGAS